MARLTISSIGSLLREKRSKGNQGIRDAATKIGISSATLSRVENGKLPDLESFSKICRWLRIDPGEVLDCKEAITSNKESGENVLSVHLRAERSMSKELTQALGEMIFAAQKMMAEEAREP